MLPISLVAMAQPIKNKNFQYITCYSIYFCAFENNTIIKAVMEPLHDFKHFISRWLANRVIGKKHWIFGKKIKTK